MALVAGTSGAEVGRHFGVYRSTNEDQKKISTDSTSDGPRSVTTFAHDRHIKTMLLRDSSRVRSGTSAKTTSFTKSATNQLIERSHGDTEKEILIRTTAEKQMHAMGAPRTFLSVFF